MHNVYSLNSTVFLEHWHLGQWFSCSMTIFERHMLFRTHGKETDQKSSPYMVCTLCSCSKKCFRSDLVFQRCHTVTFWDIMSRIPTAFLESPQWILSQTSLPPNTFKCPKQVQASEVFLGCYNHQNKCRFWIFCTMPVATSDSHLEFLSDLIQREPKVISLHIWICLKIRYLPHSMQWWKSLFPARGMQFGIWVLQNSCGFHFFFCRGIPHFQTNPSGSPIPKKPKVWQSDHPINPKEPPIP